MNEDRGPTVRRVQVTRPDGSRVISREPMSTCEVVYDRGGYALREVDGWDTPRGFQYANPDEDAAG